MIRHTCPHCGFSSLIDPGDRCPGCGYLFSYLKHQPVWTERALRESEEEIPVRRLTCALVKKDNVGESVLADCTITNQYLRIRPSITLSQKALMRLLSIPAEAYEIAIPIKRITGIEQGTHKGRPAQFFTYYMNNQLGNMNLWFHVDKGVSSRNGNIDEEVKTFVESMLPDAQIC